MQNVMRMVPKNTYEIAGHLVQKPHNADGYLHLVKRFLKKDNYDEILGGILDGEYYEGLRPEYKKIVDSYYYFADNQH